VNTEGGSFIKKGYKMKQYIFSACIFTISSIGGQIDLVNEGVVTKYNDHNKIEYIQIKRDIPKECKIANLITNKMVWTGNYANPKVPAACKSTFVHTTGHLQPMKLHKALETVGELETLAFIKEMQNNDQMLLIDSRKEKWFGYMTIPGSVNIPFHFFKYREDYAFEFEHALQELGVKVIDDGHYDFSHAKKILLFCNGAWCSQSPKMVKALLEIGYPPKKMKWYRGGMQSWLGAGLTSTRK
jgi:rhodanese-related sulfurtransferase